MRPIALSACCQGPCSATTSIELTAFYLIFVRCRPSLDTENQLFCWGRKVSEGKMAKALHKLNALQVARLSKKGRHGDGGGYSLRHLLLILLENCE
ncbi:MAG: hypothetical protein SFW09_06150 [Hyphomicrobiaceae bacterium]|nr:hypothetical protein [Hyphomicrobiaceae bacterium]